MKRSKMVKETKRKPRAFSVAPPAEGPIESAAKQTEPASKRASKSTTPTKTSPQRTLQKSKTRKPRAIKADQPKLKIETLPDDAVDHAYEKTAQAGSLEAIKELELNGKGLPVKPKRFSWGKLAFGALSLIAGLAFSLMLDQFIRDLFSRNDWLGYISLGLVGLFVLAVLVLAMRELAALRRLASVDALRKDALAAQGENNLKLARSVSNRVVSLFSSRPETARGRASLAAQDDAIMDGRDIISLVERDLLTPLDTAARAMVMGSAKRVSVVTALSPRALVDIGFVLFENIRLIRLLGEHYGGRPGFFSAMRLIRQVVFHLGATGAIAIGDGLLQQVIGHGLAARLSARLGEGVFNGLLTARIGISAMDICRPIPYGPNQRPKVSEFLSELVKLQKSNTNQQDGK